MTHTSSHELWEQERQYIDQLRREKPEWFQYDEKLNPRRILEHIGITALPADRVRGYYRLYLQDFIVEEVALDGTVRTVIPEAPAPPSDATDQRTLFFDLIKVGVFTLEAIQRLCETLQLEPKRVGHAGIKDAVAVTSQRISLRNVKYEELTSHSIPGLYLKNFSYGKGVVNVGELFGNRFTIFVRTEKPVEQKWLDQRLEEYRTKGFLNYYGVQRFGSRFSVHQFGRLVMQGKYVEALRMYLAGTNESEPPYFQAVRKKVQTLFENGRAMLAEFQRFPYSFRNELKVLEYLKQRPDDPIGALACISEHVRLWVYAYVSYLFNKKLSDATINGEPLPETLPLLLSADPADHQPYASYLQADQTENFLQHIKPFPFIRPAKRNVATIIKPNIHASRITPEGVILSFTLPKGVYATTFLMHFFDLVSGQTVPSWVKTDEQDTLALVGLGSIKPVKDVLGKYMLSRLDLSGVAAETNTVEE